MKKKSNLKFFFKRSNETLVSFFKIHFAYLLVFLFIFISIQNFVFNKKVDYNGDNATYYIGAMSIYQGDGYSNILSPEKPKTNVFPPGYSFLMSLAMHFSTSFITQKILNIIFLGLASILLYFIIYQQTRDSILSISISLLPTLNHSILQFSTKMMSESSFLLFSTIAILALFKVIENNEFKKILKDPYFYLFILTSSYSFHIRTQGIALIGSAVVFSFLIKNWKLGLSASIGFVISALPWIIRNKIENVHSSRYVEKVLAVNHWRPDEGLMSFSEMIERMYKTSKMLISQAIPDSIIPGYVVNYKEEVTITMWVIGIFLIPLIIFGYARFFKKKSWFFILYILANCFIILLWSAPSRNRYLVGFLPFIQMGMVLGIVGIFELFFKYSFKTNLNNKFFIPIIFAFSLFAFTKDIQLIKKENSKKMHPAYKNFYTAAQAVKKKHKNGEVVVCSRKPSLFYLYSNCYNTSYKSTTNDTLLIKDLIEKNVDYVVLEQLGYSSTNRYLFPAINENRQLFRTALHLKNPDTYLLWFDKKAAKKAFNM